ncbi:MAG: DUF3880 domain-containing protein [Muribaculum sp.]|nr:DUF3880 domain-containing protein [Muribaculum sp.]
MRILFYEWESYLQYDVKQICAEKGIRTDSFTWKFTDKNEDEAFVHWFRGHVDGGQYDALLSVNYWPMLSKMAQEQGLKYLAWCYDNPLNVVRPEETLDNPVNFVFFFDRIQAEQYIRAGIERVYYLPLGVNRTRLSKLCVSQRDEKLYGAEISLVGSLYESRMQELRGLADEYLRGYLDAAMAAQQNLYGCYLFDELITQELVERFNRTIQETHPDTAFRLPREALTFAMASEVTRKDRLLLLSLLGRRFDARLYSFQSSEVLQGVKCLPPVDYVEEMPKVFACSKVNLNPALRCIQSGIPLRALDVMGAGGFLLSSWQPELAEQFAQEEAVLYESLEDAVEKAEFYIKHDQIRQRIAANGRAKVLEQYSLQERLDQILETAGLTP